MTDAERARIEAEAQAILDTWQDRDDPIAELDALADKGGPGMMPFFAMLSSDLMRLMHGGEEE